MERMLQILDDIDDLCGMLALNAERLRRLLIAASSLALMLVIVALAAGLAFVHPPIALATSFLLLVTLLYRSATQRIEHPQVASS
jgi:CBS-domain-containing membrane protein